MSKILHIWSLGYALKINRLSTRNCREAYLLLSKTPSLFAGYPLFACNKPCFELRRTPSLPFFPLSYPPFSPDRRIWKFWRRGGGGPKFSILSGVAAVRFPIILY